MAKVKYPLTPQAKEAAKSLVAAWDNNHIPQLFTIERGIGRNGARGVSAEISEHYDIPLIDVLLELAQFKLVTISAETLQEDDSRFLNLNSPRYIRYWHVLLMQELRKAVASEFEVSDFFLTTQAVGTIIHAAEGSTVDIHALQSAASAFGDIEQTQINTPTELAEKLLQVLGNDTLDANPELAQAIRELAYVPEQNRKFQFGKVIYQLGNGLQHVANTAVVIEALLILARFAYSQGLL